MAKVAVIMPVYNAEAYLAAAIDSILSQTFTDFNLYAVNDGSTDGSEQIIKSYDDPRIIYVKKEANSGIVDTLNVGIKRSTEELIARMDSDDISLPERLERQVAYLDQHPDTGVVGTQIELFGSETGTWPVKLVSNEIKAKLLFRNAFIHPTVMMRRAVLDKHGLIYEKGFPHQEDYILWYRLKQKTEFANLSMVLLKYRREGQNLTEQHRETELERVRSLFQFVLKELGIEANDEVATLHYFGFVGHRVVPNRHTIRIFRRHLKEVERQNSTHKIYPQAALKKVIAEHWAHSFTPVMRSGFGKLISYWFIGKRMTFTQLKTALSYYLRKK